MIKYRSLSLSIILPSILLFVFIILQGSLFFLEYQYGEKKLYREAEKHIVGIAGQLQTGLSNALMKLKKAQAQDLIATAALEEDIITIAIVDNNHQVVLSNRFREKYLFAKLQLEAYDADLLEQVITNNEMIIKHLDSEHELIAYAPLQMISKGNSLNRTYNGVIFIRYSLKGAYRELAREGVLSLIKISVPLITILCLLIYFIYRFLLQPLIKLSNSVTGNDIDELSQIAQDGLGEVGLLQKSFAKLAKKLSKNVNTLTENEQRWLYALSGARDGVWDWDIANDRVYYSSRWKEILGYHQYEIKPDICEWEDRIHPEDMIKYFQDLRSHFIGKDSFFNNTHRIRCRNGDYLWVLSRGQTMSWDTNGDPLRIIGTITDVSAYKNSLQKVISLGNFDGVTALPNKQQLLYHLNSVKGQSLESNHHLAIIYINCKEMTEQHISINNHELLFLVACRLEGYISENSSIAHLENGEFVMILQGLDKNTEVAENQILLLTKQLDEALTKPFELVEETVTIKCLYGINVFVPTTTLSAEELLKQSILAIEKANVDYLDNIHFYPHTN